MLTASPFAINVDPKYLYLTPLLKTAVHKIQYVIEHRAGITAILGDIGLGKSSLLRYILREYAAREDYKVAIVPSPNFRSDFAFLQGISKEFGLPPRRSMIHQSDQLLDFALEQEGENRNVLLLVDEGQRLEAKMLEVLRVLVNFETNERKCLQVVLSGQLELKDRLVDKRNRSLKSRIFAPTLLSPLSLAETAEMIAFRCSLAGTVNAFDVDAIARVYEVTEGVPRDVCFICAMAWELARLSGDDKITAATVNDATGEMRGLDAVAK